MSPVAADLITPLWRQTQPPRWSAREWEYALGQARATRLLARMALRFHSEPGWWATVPEPCKPHLDSALRQAERLSADVLWELEHVAEALADVPGPVVLLKGAAYLAAGLPPGRGRLFSDIDILVARSDLRAAELQLFAAGWIPEKLEPYDDRYYRQWMHELPPLKHVLRGTCLDVHHTIAPPTSRFVIDGAALLDASVPLAADSRLRVLAPADMVLHSAVHLMQEGEFGGALRDVLDLNDLLLHFGTSLTFWEALARRSRELGVQVLVAHALGQVGRVCGTRWPEAAPLRLDARDAGATAPWMRALLSRAFRPAHFSCDTPATQAARWALYVRSHWLRMPWYRIVPHLIRKAWARSVTKLETSKATPPARV